MDEAGINVLKWFKNFCWFLLMPMVACGYIFDDLLFPVLWMHKSILFFGLAAMLNAIMDCVENEHIKITIFNKFNERFWSKRVTWNASKLIFGWKADAWHICKSLMIICILFAIIFYKPMFSPAIIFNYEIPCWDFLLLGLWWNHVFNGFYNHLFSTNNELN